MVFIKKSLAQKHVGVWKHSILTKMGNKKSSNLSIFGSKIFSSVNIFLTEKGRVLFNYSHIDKLEDVYEDN